MSSRHTVSQKHKEQLLQVTQKFSMALQALGEVSLRLGQLKIEEATRQRDAAQALNEQQAAIRSAAMAMDIDIDRELWTYEPLEGKFSKGKPAEGMQAVPTPPVGENAQADADEEDREALRIVPGAADKKLRKKSSE